jgi:hypothetical protein
MRALKCIMWASANSGWKVRPSKGIFITHRSKMLGVVHDINKKKRFTVLQKTEASLIHFTVVRKDVEWKTIHKNGGLMAILSMQLSYPDCDNPAASEVEFTVVTDNSQNPWHTQDVETGWMRVNCPRIGVMGNCERICVSLDEGFSWLNLLIYLPMKTRQLNEASKVTEEYKLDLDNKIKELNSTIQNLQEESNIVILGDLKVTGKDQEQISLQIIASEKEGVKYFNMDRELRFEQTEMKGASDGHVSELEKYELLEKPLGVEKDLDGRLHGVNKNSNSLVTKINSLDSNTKNDSQTIVNIQGSIFIQTEQVKKVDAERQQAEVRAKEDIDATVSTNAKAIADLKTEVEDAITKIEITFKQEQTKDNSALLDRLNIVPDSTASNEGGIDSLVEAGPEVAKDLVLDSDAKLKGYDESASQKLKQVLANQNNNLGDVEDRVKQNEDQIRHIDDTIDGLHKTVAIFQGRHVETVEKMKEVAVLASNTELDNGNQALLEKLLGLEKSIGDRMEGLDKTDDSLLSKINSLQTDNAQSLADFRQDLDNKLAQHDKNCQVEHDSIRSETHILTQHLGEVKSLHVATEERIVEMAGKFKMGDLIRIKDHGMAESGDSGFTADPPVEYPLVRLSITGTASGDRKLPTAVMGDGRAVAGETVQMERAGEATEDRIKAGDSKEERKEGKEDPGAALMERVQLLGLDPWLGRKEG